MASDPGVRTVIRITSPTYTKLGAVTATRPLPQLAYTDGTLIRYSDATNVEYVQ